MAVHTEGGEREESSTRIHNEEEEFIVPSSPSSRQMLDIYPSSPGASSSRVTLDDLEITTNEIASPSLAKPIISRRRIPSIHTRRVATFALSLCLPYITAADALPSPVPQNTPSRIASPISSRWANPPHHLITRAATAILVAGEYKLAKADPAVPWDWAILEQRFSPGFVVLSYLIAFVGSLCTLELLIRRTSNSGWRNQLLLASAGICFGSVSTFSMHFIFNQALTLHSPYIQGDAPLALIYGPGYTVLSLVASCAAMTIAFFVMGTDLGNWCCVFGPRSSRRKAKEEQRQAEEYKRWKMAHMKKAELLSKGSKGMGALVAAASKVAKWSLVEDPNKGEASPKGGWLSPSGKAWKSKALDEDKECEEGQLGVTIGTPRSAEDDTIAKDKKLREIDFRYGREAARAEIARMKEVSSVGTGIRKSIDHSIRHKESTASLPAIPIPAAYPPRRGSIPSHGADFSVSSSDVFLPGYNFPPRIDSSTANLLNRDTAQNSPVDSEFPTSARRGSFDIPPHVPFDYSERRASLPTVTPIRDGAFSTTLTRIQSLPEDHSDHSPRISQIQTSPPLFGKQFASPISDKGMDIMESGSDGGVTFAPEEETARSGRAERAKKWEHDGWNVKVQKFLGFDVVTKEEVFKIVLTGTIAGFGVAAMHYIGQLSIVGMPWISYDPAFVVGSVIIAAGAVVIALYIMFIMLRPKLKHGILYKICVAIVLAIAVCCMHFCGMMGTTYAWPINTPINQHDVLGGTNGAIVGIVTALAFAACLACAVFFAFEYYQSRRERERRRRVVVASIMLDDQNRILVNSTDGLPPMCDIASLSGAGEIRQSSKRSTRDSLSSGASTILGMDLTPGHEAFVNALRLSWFWRNPQYSALNPFTKEREANVISGNTNTTNGTGTVHTVAASIVEIRRGSMATETSSVIGGNARPSRLSVNRFLERFVVSAGQLAVRLTGQEDGIQRLGVLYDQITTTGWVKLSNSSDTVSKGQLLILVRRVTAAQERADLLTRHYIFADASAVAIALQKTLSVPLEHMNPVLQDVQRFCDSTTRVSLQPGTLYAGVAIVQATPFDGLRILLEERNRSQLPMRELCTFTTSTTSRISHNTDMTEDLGGSVEDIGEALTWLEGMNLLSIIGRNVAIAQSGTSAKDAIGGPVVTQLLRHIERAIVPMLDSILSQDDMAHVIPRLALHPVLVPLTPHRPRFTGVNAYIPPYMIVLYANYDAAVNTFTDKWLPFSLFRAQNSCVMAPYVGGELAIARSGTTGSTTNISNQDLPEGFNPGRRPSKVQFEVPYSAQPNLPPLPSPLAQTTTNNFAAPTIDLESGNAAPSWAGFSFPARSNRTPTSSPGGNPLNTDIVNGAAHLPSPSPLPMSINIPNHRFKEKGGMPRRSSLAKPRDFAYPAPASSPTVFNPLQEGQVDESYMTAGSGGAARSPMMDRFSNQQGWLPTTAAPGVGEWDPEWLLVLLRSKLRADA